MIEEVHYSNDMWRDEHPITDKKMICEREKVTDFADDSLGNIMKVAELGIRCFLMDRPWNQNINGYKMPSNVYRIKGIEYILEHF